MKRSTIMIAVTAVLLAGCSDTGPDSETISLDSSGEAAAVQNVAVVDPETAVSVLERDDIVIIDVRTPAEFDDGHLQNARMIDVSEPTFRDNIDSLDRDVTYVVYCRTGNRSAHAVEIMEEAGFTDLYDAGGYADLEAAGAAVNS